MINNTSNVMIINGITVNFHKLFLQTILLKNLKGIFG